MWQDTKEHVPPDHPLQRLVKHTGQFALIHHLNNMNADEIAEVQKFMDEVKKRRRG